MIRHDTDQGASPAGVPGGDDAGLALTTSAPRVGSEAEREVISSTRSDGAGAAGNRPPVPTGATIDRRTYLGASDIGAVVGLSQYKSALDVWAEKVHGVTVETTPVMRAGIVLERPIVQHLYAEPRLAVLVYPGTLRHATEEWMAATPDAIHEEPIESCRWIDIQCKLVGRGQFKRWGDQRDGQDAIPPEVLAQIQWEIACANTDAGRAVALLGTELRVYDVPRDDAFCSDLMELGRAWWKRHVIGGEMPEVTAASRDTLRRLFPRATGALLAMREDVRDLAGAFVAARERAQQAAKEREAAAAKLCAVIGEAEGFDAPDLKVTWRAQKGRIAYGDLVKSLRIPAAEQERFRAEPSRVLRVIIKED